ncbi:Metacaspase-1 [Colletotrichum siamense]|nr:Metacaspase-1 [Colletotrichum siamense]
MPIKRALLIGSPVHGLRGTENDLNTITNILKSRGFRTESETYVRRLFRHDATRQKILDAWEDLIRDTSQGDAVVIYYSGHGVCVEPDSVNASSRSSTKIQFIVPYDFDCTLETWKGISDGELSLLLRKTTAKTTNVTYILDCCHSARLGRKLGDVHFEPKAFGLDKSLHSDLAKILDKLRKNGRLAEDDLDTNPYAVRIAAAATDETAWEYHKDGHTYMGLLTKSLAKAITKPGDNRSWRDIMLEVAVLVEQDYPGGNQHPRSAGPDNRRPFSLATNATGALLSTLWDDEYTTVRGGRAHGVHEGDVFAITPFGSHSQPGSKVLTGTVTQVNAFAAVISPTPKPSAFGCMKESMAGHAVLQRSFTRWPVLLPRDFQSHPKIVSLLDKSLFLRQCAEQERPLLRLKHARDQIILDDKRGLQLAAERLVSGTGLEHVFSRVLYHAKEYVQAQNILSLRSGVDDEAFGDSMEIELGLESSGKKTILARRSES